MALETDVLIPMASSAPPALVRWPADAARRDRCAAEGLSCLLVIAVGDRPPVLASGEDWVYETADERDVAARLDGLHRSATRSPSTTAAQVPDGLSAAEHRVASRLIASCGAFVHRDDLPVADLDDVIERVRTELAPSGWLLHAVGPSGFLIEHPEQEGP